MSVRISAARACDRCRQAKRRCLPASPQERAVDTDSTSTGETCTFVLDARPRGPSKAYVQRLESQVKELEDIVRSLGQLSSRPDAQPIQPPPAVTPPQPHDCSLVRAKRPRSGAGGPLTRSSSSSTPIPSAYDPGESDRIKLAMTRLDVTDFPFRYHGSSSLHHVYLAIDGIRGYKDADFLLRVKASMRREFWVPPAWDVTSSAPLDMRPFATWPLPALERQLVDAYFDRVDLHLPLLDQEVFRSKLSGGLAIRDRRFSAVCWLVFANGARFIDDPITLYFGDTRSSGWAYFLAAKESMADADRSRPAWLPEIPDAVSLQITVLTCTWLHGAFSPHLAWLLAGSSLRTSQELGLHIQDRSTQSATCPDAAPDQHVAAAKRAFWCLYHLDINHCASGGRRPVFSEGDFDFDPPVAMYGNVASSAFAQKLLLDRVMAQALDKLYSVQPGSIDDVEALLSSTEHWHFALPSFLRPIPESQNIGPPGAVLADPVYSADNASLAIHYHYVRLLIRRPLLPRSSRPPHEHREALDRSLADCFAITFTLDKLLRCNTTSTPITSEIIHPVWTVFAIMQLALEYSYRTSDVLASDQDVSLPSENGAESSNAQRVADRHTIVAQMDICVSALSAIELRWRYAGKLTDWVSESMRTLCHRFQDAFRSHLRSKWGISPALSNNNPSMSESDRPLSCPANLEELRTDRDAHSGTVDYDLIFSELFGVMPWTQT